MNPTHRLAPDLPLPPYAFVPGRHPHPVSDPAGHSYGAEPAWTGAVDPERWRELPPYRFGLDLFNAGFYWESHAQFECLWLACGRRGAVADFLKGLIKLAAAGVKHAEGRPQGVRSHARRAAELFRGAADTSGRDRCFGLSLAALVALAETVDRNGWPGTAPLLLPQTDGEGR